MQEGQQQEIVKSYYALNDVLRISNVSLKQLITAQ